MALVNTQEFWIIGIIFGAILVIGIIYKIKQVSSNNSMLGGRRKKRPRQIRKKRR